MPFRDPDEALKARVDKLEEELEAQRREIERLAKQPRALGRKLDEALELLKRLHAAPEAARHQTAKPALDRVEASLSEAKREAEAEPAPVRDEPRKGDEPPRGEEPRVRASPARRHLRWLIALVAVALAAGYGAKKWWPRNVMALELGGVRLLTPMDGVKAAVNEELSKRHGVQWPRARALVGGEPASCTYDFLAAEQRLSRVSCELAPLPDKNDTDAMVDGVIAYFEQRLGWPMDRQDTDYGSWRRTAAAWRGGGASLQVSMDSPSICLVTLELDGHEDTARELREREEAERLRKASEEARRRREEQRRELTP